MASPPSVCDKGIFHESMGNCLEFMGGSIAWKFGKSKGLLLSACIKKGAFPYLLNVT